MTQKDFNELAEQLAIVRRDIINQMPDKDKQQTAKFTWMHCVDAVMRACRTTSANFNIQNFRDACNK